MSRLMWFWRCPLERGVVNSWGFVGAISISPAGCEFLRRRRTMSAGLSASQRSPCGPNGTLEPSPNRHRSGFRWPQRKSDITYDMPSRRLLRAHASKTSGSKIEALSSQLPGHECDPGEDRGGPRPQDSGPGKEVCTPNGPAHEPSGHSDGQEYFRLVAEAARTA